MEATITTGFMDKAIIGLKKALVELEEFQEQLKNGKVETLEKFHDLKKKFHDTIHESKQKLKHENITAKDLTKKIEKVQNLLISGKIQTKEAFSEQREKILHTLHEVEESLKTSGVDRDYYFKLKTEIEKFKIKIEILKLKFEVGTLVAKEELESFKSEFGKMIDKIRMKFNEEETVIVKNWNHFSDEVSEAYSHLKKAFTLA